MNPLSPEEWKQLSPYLDRALSLSGEQRAAWLAALRGENAGLAEQVEELLHERTAADREGFLLKSPVSTGTTTGAEPAEKRIGPYQLIQKIGEGGMGDVWLAEQEAPVRRRVALKLIRAGLNTRETLARFDSERQALALMEHPAIAKVFEAGATPQGSPYFAMEYVAGIPITEYCDKHRLSTKERLWLFTQVCEGVQHAHQKAIIHRDLKPSNILVMEVDGKPAPKIIDFGLAKALTQKLTAETMFTRAGGVIGTPGYMSPEQAGSSGTDVDTRTDVYSLGVIFYELLAGSLPLDLDLRHVALEEFLRRLREVEPPRPSSRLSTQNHATSTDVAHKRQTEPQTLARQLQGELDSIALKALEKEQSRRYASASEFAADVRRYLNNEPVLAVPPSAAYRARKFAHRYRVPLATAAAFAVLLLGTTAVSVRQSLRANREAAAARRVSEFMTQMFKVSDPGEARGNSITAREILDKASKEIDTGLANDPQLQSQMMQTMGKVYASLGLYQKAELLFRQAVSIRKAASGPTSREALESASSVGAMLQEESRFPESEKTLRDTMELQRQTFGPNDRDTLESARLLARTMDHEGRYLEAEQLNRETLEIATRVYGAQDDIVRNVRKGLAADFAYEGKFADAEKTFREVYEADRRESGDDNPAVLKVQSNIAAMLLQQDHFSEAETLYRDTVARETRVLGAEHPVTVQAMSNLALVLRSEKRYSEADKLLREALAAELKVYGPDHEFTLNTMNILAGTLELEDKDAEAEQIIREALERQRRVLGPDHQNTLTSMEALGAIQLDEKKNAEAEQTLRQALEGFRRVLGDDHPLTAEGAFNLGATQAQEGKRAEALRNLEFALAHHLAPHHLAGVEEDYNSLHGDPRFKVLVAKAHQLLADAQK